MHIFIDETGVFANPSNKEEAISAVGALCVPNKQLDSLSVRFEKLKGEWGLSGIEAKGGKLSEAQIAQSLALMQKHGVRAKLVMIDLGLHKNVDLEQHRSIQADRLTASLTPQHQPSLRAELESLQGRLRSLSLPLYVQSVLLTELVAYALQNFTLWHAFRDGSELGTFSWVVDPKDKNRTEYEELWQSLILPFVQTRFLQKPLALVDGGDYKTFERFKRELSERPTWLPKVGTATDGQSSYYDPRPMLKEDFKYLQSDAVPGLQLVDIAVTTLRRALVGTLQPHGWQPLSGILICEKPSTIGFLGLRLSIQGQPRTYSGILNWIHDHACSMIP
jgi:hypothetical protein